MSIRVVSSFAVFAIGLVIVSARGQSDFAIAWRSGSVAIDGGVPVADALNALADREWATHIVVTLTATPSVSKRRELAAAGIRLLNSLGSHSYFATVDRASFDVDRALRLNLVRSAVAIRPEWKLHPRLARGNPPDWAIVRNAPWPDRLAVYVFFHADVPLHSTGVVIARRYGAVVRSVLRSVNGMVLEVSPDRLAKLAKEDAVQWVEPPLPAFSEANDSNRALTEAEIAQARPVGLSGDGVTVLVYDAGIAAHEHPDFGARMTVREEGSPANHATHVAGTIGGDGFSSGGLFRGMAPAVEIESYSFNRSDSDLVFLYEDPGDIESNYAHAVHVFGADLANNSIGTNTCRNGFDCEITGDYGMTATVIDAIVAGALGRPLPILWANGNERSCSRCRIQGVHTPEGYHSTAPPACAKNQISVGAVNSNDDSVTGFTSWGPCDDGRLKPDISAPGCQADEDFGVTSCCFVGQFQPDCADVSPDEQNNCCFDSDGDGFGYDALCGTSMATPTVTGLTALFIEAYRDAFPQRNDPLPATIKALYAHTAADVEQPGPDYKTGYGSIRIVQTIDFMHSGSFVEGLTSQGEARVFFVNVESGDDGFKATLAWDDVPCTPNVDIALVNDLDLVVTDPDGVRHYPWTLDPDNPGAAAVRTVEDNLNNVEQVVVDGPTAGFWRVEVVGFDVAAGPQSFSLCAMPNLDRDCNANSIPDSDEVLAGAADCTGDGVLDECEPDCDGNGVADSCDIAFGAATDCNNDGAPDGSPCDPFVDCNENGVHDACDVQAETSADCNRDSVPDECEDCNRTGLAGECDIALGLSDDCNLNGQPDECDLTLGFSDDCNRNFVPDECETDCNENGEPDDCDIASGESSDCNGTGVPDACELDAGVSLDCNENLVPDGCDIFVFSGDDCDGNYIPDECEQDCNLNGQNDICDIAYGVSPDADENGVPDECLDVFRVPDQYATIRAAIDAAGEGDTVLVADGVYTGFGNKNLSFGGKNLTVRSEDGPQNCIIDCQNIDRAFRFVDGETASSLVQGLTIRNGNNAFGGGIHCVRSSPRIEDCVIENCFGYQWGGGINIEYASPRIRHCRIVNNHGAFFSGGITVAFSSPIIEQCVIAGNTTGTPPFSGEGGGLYLYQDSATVDSCIIASNSAVYYGGGVYGWASQSKIINCTVVHNSAGTAGGGFSLWNRSDVRLDSSIVRDNAGKAGDEFHNRRSHVRARFNNLLLDAGDVEGQAVELIEGNIFTDPVFVDADGEDDDPVTWADNDLHLSERSPCVDAGGVVNSAIGRRDIDGEPRALAGVPDIGADELPADCNGNGQIDHVEIAKSKTDDCNVNWIPDECEIENLSAADRNENGIPDACECAYDASAPQLDHERMCAEGGADFPFEQAVVPGGYIDPRLGSFDNRTPQLSLDAVTLIFTEPVYDVSSTSGGDRQGELAIASFSVNQTGDGDGPSVTRIVIDSEDPTRVRVEFDRAIAWREWTTIVANVEDRCGRRIASIGDAGPGVSEPDRIDIASLPGDFDQDGVVAPFDLLHLRRLILDSNFVDCPSRNLLADVDRNGVVESADLLRFRQAVAPFWSGQRMNHDQP